MLKLNLDVISTSSRLMHANPATLLRCNVGSSFSFTCCFAAVQLFAASKFSSYQNTFPTAVLKETIRLRAYPFLDSERLPNELSFCTCKKKCVEKIFRLSQVYFGTKSSVYCTFPNIVKLL